MKPGLLLTITSQQLYDQPNAEFQTSFDKSISGLFRWKKPTSNYVDEFEADWDELNLFRGLHLQTADAFW